MQNDAVAIVYRLVHQHTNYRSIKISNSKANKELQQHKNSFLLHHKKINFLDSKFEN